MAPPPMLAASLKERPSPDFNVARAVKVVAFIVGETLGATLTAFKLGRLPLGDRDLNR